MYNSNILNDLRENQNKDINKKIEENNQKILFLYELWQKDLMNAYIDTPKSIINYRYKVQLNKLHNLNKLYESYKLKL